MSYERLQVYRKSYELALEIHKESLGFPKAEQYELSSQLRRASKSISANIAEGMGKQSSAAEVSRYIKIALGSCDEVRVWLSFSKDLGYIDLSRWEELKSAYEEVGRMLTGLVKRFAMK